MIRNLPCNAEDPDSIPGGGTKIPCAPELLSLQVTRESVGHSKRSHAMQ